MKDSKPHEKRPTNCGIALHRICSVDLLSDTTIGPAIAIGVLGIITVAIARKK
jgi:hypothetical protein